ncbi:MAG: subclass B1 metallo-beta-lactamase [Saprospiraceae bacterium]|nr:subclass B1 metallo-beta-lactamase [Saprospiraceae bacterium]
MNFKLILLLATILMMGCKTRPLADTETFKITQLTANTFVHITYLQTTSFGKVACNGLIFRNKDEAIIFDTPSNDTVANELIDWVEKQLRCQVKGIVVNHFHNDCLGGLKAFHKRNVLSHANSKTIELAQKQQVEVPQNGFEGKQELWLGDKKIINQFYGSGHTHDNIVSYIPSENVLFGGCLIKAVGADFGYLGDADVKEWSNTVKKVKEAIPTLKFVVPGHGKAGGTELLDYTIQKFKDKKP